MTFRFDERPNARRVDAKSYETQYVAAGEQNGATVRAYAANLTPPMVASGANILFRDDIQVAEQGAGVHYVTVRYVTADEQQEKNRPTGTITFQFSTTGGTFHLQRALEHVASYGPGQRFNGFINVVKNGGDFEIQGCDVVIPSLKLSVTVTHPLGFVTLNHAKTIASVTGCVNSATFLGFAAGEVLFLGADGSDGTNADASLTYHFVAEANLTGLDYSDDTTSITGVAKDGHDLLWIATKPGDDGGTPAKPTVKVLGVHVERVYRRVDLRAALGFG